MTKRWWPGGIVGDLAASSFGIVSPELFLDVAGCGLERAVLVRESEAVWSWGICLRRSSSDSAREEGIGKAAAMAAGVALARC
jgi:hypothetical protein